jgi:hypothetical protein
MTPVEHFNKFGYVIIKQVLPETICNLYYSYSISKLKKSKYKMEETPESYNTAYDGWQGEKLEGVKSFNFYGDEFTEVMLEAIKPYVEKSTDLELHSTYGFLRVYSTDDVLPMHVDRKSCAVSCSLNIGHNIENLEDKDYKWPFKVKIDNDIRDLILNTGDIVIYKGCELIHGRPDGYKGNNHAQAFLHYNTNDKYDRLFDNRKHLGLPHPSALRKVKDSRK